MQHKIHTLRNGVRIIFVPVKDMTTATMITVVGTGSRFEDEHENGIAHFLEHLFFKGTEQRPGPEFISRELDALGASYNAYTGKERTGYWAKVASPKIMDAVDVVQDLFLNSIIKPKDITKEAEAIVQEISMYNDRPSRLVYDLFEEVLYGKDHPLGRAILGSPENVRSFRKKDFEKYKRERYTGANTVVCVAGNFPQGKVLARLRKVYSVLKAGEKNTFAPYEDMQTEPQLRIQHKETDQSHLMMGVKACHATHEDRYALSVLAQILGGGMSSRLFTEIREKRGLAYSVGAMMDFLHDTGALIIYAGIEHDNVTKAMSLALKEMKSLAKKGPSAEELMRAKSGFEGRTAFGYETSDDIAEHLAEQLVMRDQIILPKETLKRVEKVTAEDIKRVAQKYFIDQGLNCAIIGPHKKNIKKIKEVLSF